MENLKEANIKIHQFYGRLYKQYGLNPRSFDYSGDVAQQSRFEVLTGILPPPGAERHTVLDVGCGFGDLLKFLNERGYNVTYTGVDITPEFISVAVKNLPEAQFVAGDFLSMDFKDTFDYVFCSGTLNYLIPNAWAWVQEMIAGMVQAAKVAVAFNLTSIYTEEGFRNDHTFYGDPAAVFTFCRSLVKRVALLHHYRPNDFTVYLYKQDFDR